MRMKSFVFENPRTKMRNQWRMEALVAIGLIVAIGIILLALLGRPARGDGLREGLRPPPVASESCLMTALQLGYQTGRPDVAHAATEACLAFTQERGAILPYAYPRYYAPRYNGPAR